MRETDECPTWQPLADPETLLNTRIGSVLSERFRCLRTGAEGDFISFRFPDWVVVLAETPDHKLVMVRQFRHGDHSFQWEIPGGCMDETDPDPVTAGLRELREETGYTGTNARLLGAVCPNPALQSNRCYTVFVEHAVKTRETELEDTESLQVFEMDFNRILAMIRSGEMNHGIMMDSMFYYLLLKQQDLTL